MTESGARMISTGMGDMKPYGQEHGLVIAVDGPSGSGKSTAARNVAIALGLRYLDTGSMYRAMTWWMLTHGVSVADSAAVVARLAEPAISVGTDPATPQILVDGQDVAGPIRERDVSNTVSFVAAVPEVREMLIGMQRQIIGGGGIVAEGRDIGTVVAPDAAIKVFLTANEEVRAKRRSAELSADPAASVDTTRQEQALRDKRDAAQMVMANDAVELDTSELGLDEVVARIVDLAKNLRVVGHG